MHFAGPEISILRSYVGKTLHRMVDTDGSPFKGLLQDSVYVKVISNILGLGFVSNQNPQFSSSSPEISVWNTVRWYFFPATLSTQRYLT